VDEKRIAASRGLGEMLGLAADLGDLALTLHRQPSHALGKKRSARRTSLHARGYVPPVNILPQASNSEARLASEGNRAQPK